MCTLLDVLRHAPRHQERAAREQAEREARVRAEEEARARELATR